MSGWKMSIEARRLGKRTLDWGSDSVWEKGDEQSFRRR
jgi:hypothetical protein